MFSVPPTDGPDGQIQLHASTVAVDGVALAIIGPSGAGKSAFALAMMARGAGLVADDITWLSKSRPDLIASCPPKLSGRIEARGIGILSAPATSPTPLRAIVDLGRPETDRLPDAKFVTLDGIRIRLFHSPAMEHFIDAMMLYMSQHTPD